METKSKGQIRYERGLAEIQEQAEQGDFADPFGLGRAYGELLDLAFPEMTASERDAVQRTRLNAHQLGADLLADHGRPVPGNDRSRPN